MTWSTCKCSVVAESQETSSFKLAGSTITKIPEGKYLGVTISNTGVTQSLHFEDSRAPRNGSMTYLASAELVEGAKPVFLPVRGSHPLSKPLRKKKLMSC